MLSTSNTENCPTPIPLPQKDKEPGKRVEIKDLWVLFYAFIISDLVCTLRPKSESFIHIQKCKKKKKLKSSCSHLAFKGREKYIILKLTFNSWESWQGQQPHVTSISFLVLKTADSDRSASHQHILNCSWKVKSCWRKVSMFWLHKCSIYKSHLFTYSGKDSPL